jgi:hypothetical protein
MPKLGVLDESVHPVAYVASPSRLRVHAHRDALIGGQDFG